MRYLAGVTSLAYDQERCTGCGRCTEVCPHGVFLLQDRKATVSDRDRCMECGACVRNCEFGAIAVTAGVGCASAIITSMITGGEPVCDCSGSPPDAASGRCCG